MLFRSLEAMGASLAIVATDVPGHRDVIVRGQTGLLVPPEDSAALAEAITSLVADPARRRRMGRAGRQRVLEHFAIETMVDKTADVYRGAVGAAARPGVSDVLTGIVSRGERASL